MPKLHPYASFVRVQPAMEPEDVLWENLGNPFYEKLLRGSLLVLIIAFELIGRYFIQWAFTIITKKKNIFTNMDCSSLRKGTDFPFSDSLALIDYNRPVE